MKTCGPYNENSKQQRKFATKYIFYKVKTNDQTTSSYAINSNNTDIASTNEWFMNAIFCKNLTLQTCY